MSAPVVVAQLVDRLLHPVMAKAQRCFGVTLVEGQGAWRDQNAAFQGSAGTFQKAIQRGQFFGIAQALAGALAHLLSFAGNVGVNVGSRGGRE